MANFSDEDKDALVQEYLAHEPTADNSIEIVHELAAKHNHSANGIRMILVKRGAYVTKTPGTKTTTTTAASGDKPARVGKDAAHARLSAAITATGQDPDSEIVTKLTGKAALYFAEVLEAAASKED